MIIHSGFKLLSDIDLDLKEIYKNVALRNYVRNGDFSRWDAGVAGQCPTGWTGSNCGDVNKDTDPGDIIVGDGSMREGVAAGWHDRNQVITNWAELAGKTVTLGAWLKASANMSANFYFWDGVAASFPTLSLTTVWQFFIASFNVNAAATILEVQCYRKNNPTATVWVDGVILVKGSGILVPVFHWK